MNQDGALTSLTQTNTNGTVEGQDPRHGGSDQGDESTIEDELLVEELLVEEISIDGMCGVY